MDRLLEARLAVRIVFVGLVGLGWPAAAQTTLYLSSDVPADPAIGSLLQPWQVVEFDGSNYTVALDVPGVLKADAVNAAHKLDRPDNWLFSLGVPGDLGGALPDIAERRDVIRFDGTGFSIVFRGGSLVDPIPGNNGIDAIYLDGADTGNLVLSLATAAEIPAGSGMIHEPADLLRYRRSGPGSADWIFDGVAFDASAAGLGIAGRLNVVGADSDGARTLFVLDNPAELRPSAGPAAYERGQVIAWDGANFDLLETLPSWQGNRKVNSLSCQANPGRVPIIHVNPSQTTVGDLTVDWSSSCSSGAEDYAIYEGILGNYYSHVMKDCSDDSGDLVEDVSPIAVSSYYLVVPHNKNHEGSYGANLIAGVTAQRPQPPTLTDRCSEERIVTACPP